MPPSWSAIITNCEGRRNLKETARPEVIPQKRLPADEAEGPAPAGVSYPFPKGLGKNLSSR